MAGAPKSIGSFESSTGMSDASSATLPGNPNTRVFYSAVVVDFIGNPRKDLLLEEYPNAGNEESEEVTNYGLSLQKGINSVGNPQYVSRMPRNTIVAKIVTAGAGKSSPPAIFYPFFSPHFCMPVSAGEQVWIAYEEAGSPTSLGYWVCRKPTDIQVDDLNYTHRDRETLLLPTAGQDQSAIAAQGDAPAESPPDPYSFPKGGKKKKDNNSSVDEDPYETIIENSQAYQNQFVGEPVPRFSKRSSDITLQGSNNALLVLGRDRTSTADSDNDENKDIPDLSGTIDIVCGRGQDPATSAVAEAECPRGYSEIAKAPSVSGEGDPNVDEGDPDFINDLSRVYVSMNTDGDTNFGLSFTNDEAPEVKEGPFVIAKSTEIRMVAKDGGSVRMVKEGDSQCEICLMSDGTISIEGGKIYLGENASGNETQPVVQGQLLLDAVKTFSSELQAAVAGSIGNFGAPVSMPTLATACATFEANVESALSTMVYTK